MKLKKFHKEKKDFISNLPVEVSLSILKLMSTNDLLSCCKVSRRWNSLSSDNLLWFNLCLQMNLVLLEDYKKDGQWKQMYLRLLSKWRCEDLVQPVISKVPGHCMITAMVMQESTIIIGSDDHSLSVFNASTGQLHRTLTGHTGSVWALAATVANGHQLVISAGADGSVRVWQIATGACICVWRGHEGLVRCLDTCGNLVVSGGRDGTVRVWDLSMKEYCLAVLRGHLGSVHCVKTDGITILSGSYDWTVRVWNLANSNDNNQLVHILTGHTNRVYSVTLTDAGTKAISTSLDTTLRLWNVQTGVCLRIFTGHRSLTCEVVVAAGGDLLITGNADRTVKVWQTTSGRCIATIMGHSMALTGVQTVMDQFVVSGSLDGSIKLWHLPSGRFVKELLSVQGAVIRQMVATNRMLVCIVDNGVLDNNHLYLFDFS